MAFTFRKSMSLERGLRLNLSKSGLSVSNTAGPLTLNSRGRASLRLGKGMGFGKKLW